MKMVVTGVVVIAIVIAVAIWYFMNNGGVMNGAVAHQRITPQAYQTSFAQRDHLLVDVRTAEEFRAGHIPGAINIALQDLPKRMDTLSKEQNIVVYCRSGARSNTAATMLTRGGFANVQDLGGIMTWQAQGLPIQ